MDIFWKVTVGIMISVILSLTIWRNSSGISILLTIAVCAMSVSVGLSCLRPVILFIDSVLQIGNLNGAQFGILLKIVGIGLISQIAILICTDAGNQTLGKALQIVSSAVMLSISMPLLEQILQFIEAVLGEI